MHDTATAYQAWDRRWRTETGRADWSEPEPWVKDQAVACRIAGAMTALDLGSGLGRHALFLARIGYATRAIDASEAALAHLRDGALKAALSIEATQGAMTDLPYPDASFDYVLAFNVVYHGDGEVVRRSLAEINRVLKPGGTYQGTMLSKRNSRFGDGREIAADTFVLDELPPEDSESDKVHPHFYCDAAGLVALHDGFELLSLSDRTHRKPGSWHWHVVAERRR